MIRNSLLIALCSLIAGCANSIGENTMSSNDYELPQNCDFNEAENNSTSEFACTPKLLDPLFSDFRGIIINAPALSEWPANEDPKQMLVTPNGNSSGPFKAMISGYFILDVATGENAMDLAERVILVAVNQQTAESYSGKMENIGFRESPMAGLPISAENTVETVSSSFNIDLYQNLNIPIAAATYSVYATVDEYKSNTMVVEIALQ
ncbi:hypothetical protein SAMN02745866_03711 [Alteromonadaceae bacterium Bs31]|nr:hypothetical protein SAMN02745866_03711 [Alteromonadaceae bacterium Bs31]